MRCFPRYSAGRPRDLSDCVIAAGKGKSLPGSFEPEYPTMFGGPVGAVGEGSVGVPRAGGRAVDRRQGRGRVRRGDDAQQVVPGRGAQRARSRRRSPGRRAQRAAGGFRPHGAQCGRLALSSWVPGAQCSACPDSQSPTAARVCAIAGRAIRCVAQEVGRACRAF